MSYWHLKVVETFRTSYDELVDRLEVPFILGLAPAHYARTFSASTMCKGS